MPTTQGTLVRVIGFLSTEDRKDFVNGVIVAQTYDPQTFIDIVENNKQGKHHVYAYQYFNEITGRWLNCPSGQVLSKLGAVFDNESGCWRYKSGRRINTIFFKLV